MPYLFPNIDKWKVQACPNHGSLIAIQIMYRRAYILNCESYNS